MAVNTMRKRVDYGLTNALQTISPQPIVAQRNPTTTDYAEVGTIWVNKTNNTYYILTSITASVANWETSGGGAGDFTSLVVNPGNITATAGNIIATAGSISAGTTVTAGTGITATTGNITATAGGVSAGTTVAAGTTITAGTGITATTGNIVATVGNLVATAGSISAGTTVTGNTGLTATTGNITASTGNITATLGNITATAGAVSAGTSFSFVAGPKILFGTGSPNAAVTAPQGSLFLRTDGAGGTTAYTNTNGATAWAALA